MITVHTNNAQELIKKINELISNNKFGYWKIDDDGDYFLEDYRNKVWITCRVEEFDPTLIMFCIIRGKNTTLTKCMYAINHCNFLQALLMHFDDDITSISVSPLITKFDKC